MQCVGPMLGTLGANECVRTIHDFCRSHFEPGLPDDLKRAYQRALRGLQPNVHLISQRGIDLVSGGPRLQELGTLFGLRPPPLAPQSWQTSLILSGIARLSERDRSLAEIVTLVLNSAFASGPRPGDCSSNREALGVVHINPAHDWTEDDVIEALCHGAVHTLLGLDRLRHGHVAPQERLTLVPTAVSGVRRPLVVAAHSVVVAAEILVLRARSGIAGVRAHPDTPSLLRTARAAIAELAPHRALLTSRMGELISVAERALLPRTLAAPTAGM